MKSRSISPVLTIGAGAYAALVAATVGLAAFIHLLVGAFSAVGEWLAQALS